LVNVFACLSRFIAFQTDSIRAEVSRHRSRLKSCQPPGLVRRSLPTHHLSG
jgi:hypothetical protein